MLAHASDISDVVGIGELYDKHLKFVLQLELSLVYSQMLDTAVDKVFEECPRLHKLIDISV